MNKIAPSTSTSFTTTASAPTGTGRSPAAAWERVAVAVLDCLHPEQPRPSGPSLSSLLAQMQQPDHDNDESPAAPCPGSVVPALDRTAARDNADHAAQLDDDAARKALVVRTLPADDASDLLAWIALEADEQDAVPAPPHRSFVFAAEAHASAHPAGPDLAGMSPFGRPAADLLSAEMIAAAIAEGDDPFAMDSVTASYSPPYPHQAAELLAIARLAQTLKDQAGVNALLARNAATVLLCASPEEIKQIDPILRIGLRCDGGAADDAARWALRRAISTPKAKPGTDRTRDLETAAAKLADPAPLIVLLRQTDDLTGALTHLPVLTLARLNADAVVWTLRQTHSATGQIAEDAVRAALPSDAELARIADDLVALAFREDNPLRVAAKLAEMATSRASATCVDHAGPGPRLEDLPGLGAARQPLVALGSDLAAYATGALPWAEMTSGLILAGPPGTGKTTIAAALARSAGVPLIATSYSAWHRAGRFNEMLVAMATAFEEARAAAPSILFIDEIDSLGSRSSPRDQNSSYERVVINGLLDQIDGVAGREGVLIIGATNHSRLLDPALVRPGRFGREIQIAAPRERDLPDVFRYHLGSDLPGLDLGPLARVGAGMSQAEVMGAVQTARTAARNAGRPLAGVDLAVAVGERHPAVPDGLRNRIAIHEAGHAVVAHLGGFAKVLSATVSGGGGHVEVQVLPHANEKEAVTATLMRHLAGRAAEDVLLGSVSGGAGGSDTSDLANATRAAITEALSLGRGGDLIWHPVDEPPAVLFASHPGLKDRVLKRVKGAYAGARALICNNREAVEVIASHLVVDGHLDQADLRDLLLFCQTAPRGNDGAQGVDMFGLKP